MNEQERYQAAHEAFDYSASVLDAAAHFNLPPAFALLSDGLGKSRDLRDYEAESVQIDVDGKRFSAYQIGSIQFFDISPKIADSVSLSCYGFQIDHPIFDERNPSDAQKSIRLALKAYTMVAKASWKGLSNPKAVEWMYDLLDRSQSKKSMPFPREEYDQWDVARLRLAWQMCNKEFELLLDANLDAGGMLFSSDELHILGILSAQFLHANAVLPDQSVIWQYQQLQKITLIQGEKRKQI